MKNLQELYEQYKFDSIVINKDNVDDLDFELIPEEMFVDFGGAGNYYGKIKLDNRLIEVYWGDVQFNEVIIKYKNLSNERKVKLDQLFKKEK